MTGLPKLSSNLKHGCNIEDDNNTILLYKAYMEWFGKKE